MKKFLNNVVFYALSFTWGAIMSLIGLVAVLVLWIKGYKPQLFHNRIYVEVGHNWGGVSLGCFILVCKEVDYNLLAHEAGHGIQNAIFGPLFPFVIAIPSAIRYWYRYFKYDRQNKKAPTAYDAIWFEGWATDLGRKYFKKSN